VLGWDQNAGASRHRVSMTNRAAYLGEASGHRTTRPLKGVNCCNLTP